MRPLRPRVIVVVRPLDDGERRCGSLREDAMRTAAERAAAPVPRHGLGRRPERHGHPARQGEPHDRAREGAAPALASRVACSRQRQGVLQPDASCSALWDVPMMVLHGSRRLVRHLDEDVADDGSCEGFDADNVHEDLLQACAWVPESTCRVRASGPRSLEERARIMLHSIDASSNAFERLFRIELSGDQLIETALRSALSALRAARSRCTPSIRSRSPTLALYVGLAATLASVFVSNFEVFGSDAEQPVLQRRHVLGGSPSSRPRSSSS